MKEIAKNYNAQEFEQKIYKQWEGSGVFDPDNLNTNKKYFSIVLPPPNATGVLHLGHAAMLAYQDTMVRYHRMLGERTLWVPGTDHAAIATQNVVEKKIAKEQNKTKENLGREGFLKEVRDFVASTQDNIRNQIRHMGSSVDWSRERYTLSDSLSQAVNMAFKKMYDDGLIYRGYRIVNWCPRCHSTLSDDEVEHTEQKGKLYYFKYGPVEIATTRPETKIGDTGLAVNPKDDRYKEYIGQILEFRLGDVDLKVKVFASEEVDMEFGTGAIGVTPAHSAVDYEWAQKNDLEVRKVIDENGKMTELAGKYAGMTVEEARSKFVEAIKASGQMVKIEEYNNNLSVCYRCSTAIEPLTSEQWFINVNKEIPGKGKSLKELAIQAVEKGIHRRQIKIMPDKFRKVYFHWMNNLHDWCISRQIWWGHRIPVYYCIGDDACKLECKNPIVSIKPVTECPYCGSKNIKQDEDTLDTWFSSALWTFSTLLDQDYDKYSSLEEWVKNSPDLKYFHPTTVMETGYDILFFWVARMILMTTYLLDEIPFETVYLHGLIRDKQGRKMSKSLGNGIDPIEMVKKFGADALRLSMMVGATPGNDMRLYEEKIEGYRNFVNKLWNISRYIMSSVKDVKIVDKKPKAKTIADTWILFELDSLIEETTKDLDELKFSFAIERLYEFTWSKFADWYIEISKVETGKDNILLYVLEQLLKLWHPFAPYVTEVIWGNFNNGKLIISKWPKAKISFLKRRMDMAVTEFVVVRDLIAIVRNVKGENRIDPAKIINCMIFNEDGNELIDSNRAVIEKLARIKLVESPSDGWLEMHHEGFDIAIDIDKDEAAKLQAKQKKELEVYVASLQKKLSNDKFVKNAPADVVAKERAKLAEAEERLNKLTT